MTVREFAKSFKRREQSVYIKDDVSILWRGQVGELSQEYQSVDAQEISDREIKYVGITNGIDDEPMIGIVVEIQSNTQEYYHEPVVTKVRGE